MVCLGFEPGAAEWKARTNPLSYGGTPKSLQKFDPLKWSQYWKQFNLNGLLVGSLERFEGDSNNSWLVHNWLLNRPLSQAIHL